MDNNNTTINSNKNSQSHGDVSIFTISEKGKLFKASFTKNNINNLIIIKNLNCENIL